MLPQCLVRDGKVHGIMDAMAYAISIQFGIDVSVSPMPTNVPMLTKDWRYAQIALLRVPVGALVLGGSTETLEKLAWRFLPSEIKIDEDWIEDLLCETVNVCAGQLKTLLKETPFHFRLTTPNSVDFYDLELESVTWFSVTTGEGELIFGVMI